MRRWPFIAVSLLLLGLGFLLGRVSVVPVKPAPPPPPAAPRADPPPVREGRGVFVDVPSRLPAFGRGDRVDLFAVLPADGGSLQGVMLLQNVELAYAEPLDAGLTRLGLTLMPEETPALQLARARGTIDAALRNPDDVDVMRELGSTSIAALLSTERMRVLQQKRFHIYPDLLRGPATVPPPTLAKHYRAAYLEVPAAPLQRGSRVDVLAALPDPGSGDWAARVLFQAVTVVAATPGPNGTTRLTLELIPEEAEALFLARSVGSLDVSLRDPADPSVLEDPAALTLSGLAESSARDTLARLRESRRFDAGR